MGILTVMIGLMFLSYLTLADGDPAPGADPGTQDDSGSHSDPKAPDPAQQTITVDGVAYTPEQIRRHAQQAKEATKIFSMGYGEAIKKNIRYEDLARQQADPGVGSQPDNSPPPARSSVNPEELSRQVYEAVNTALDVRETDRAMRSEHQAVNDELLSLGFDPKTEEARDYKAGIQNIINLGLPDGKGGRIPGTACVRMVDGKPVPVPATPEIVKKAVEAYFDSMVKTSQKVQEKKLGKQPEVPPGGTGTGATAPAEPASKHPLQMSREEREKYNKDWYEKRQAARSGATASSTKG